MAGQFRKGDPGAATASARRPSRRALLAGCAAVLGLGSSRGALAQLQPKRDLPMKPLPGAEGSIVVTPNWGVWGDAAWAGAQAGVRMWQQNARLTGVRVTGPVATEGRLEGPGLGPSIIAAMTGAGAHGRTASRFAQPVEEAWRAWQDGVRVPGLPWYPSFAAFPGPQAPPTANIPSPLSSLPSAGAQQLTAASLVDRIRASLAAAADQPGAADAISLFASRFANRFNQWRVTVMVSLVMGSGTVPTWSTWVPFGMVQGFAASAPGASFSQPPF